MTYRAQSSQRRRDERAWLVVGDHAGVEAQLFQIVGWRIDGQSAWPILPGDRSDGDRLLVVLPGGRLEDPFVGTYADIEEAKAAILAEYRQGTPSSHATVLPALDAAPGETAGTAGVFKR